jgi:uncharacterized protein
MKWIGRRQSDNVEDRRGMSSGGKVVAGGGAIGIIIFLINAFGGENVKQLVPVLEQFNQQGTTQSAPANLSAEQIELGNFAKTVFADTEDIWQRIFEENNSQYTKPGMVLFSRSVETACGGASSQSGPFYCPADQKVYIDLDFFEELKSKFGAKGGDFAIAYVIAHEVGHHIQTVIGTSTKVREKQAGLDEASANKLSVALELQADFYAGVWSKYNQQYLDAGDIDEALSAAQAVGDDAIQKKMQGVVIPESFTHGTSEQRKYWFMRGYETGDIRQGNTFAEMQ